MRNKLKVLLVSGIALLVISGAAEAAPIETAVVNGNTYSCYILSTLDILGVNMEFEDRGGLVMSNFSTTLSTITGIGFYFTITNFFAASYWALDANIGQISGDTLFLFIGNTFDPFIVGVGILSVEYRSTHALTFFGFRVIEE